MARVDGFFLGFFLARALVPKITTRAGYIEGSLQNLEMATANTVDSTGSTLLDMVLQYGLFIGAIFQIVCIFAVVLIPQNEEEQVQYLLHKEAC